jgi:hypothetical protein
MKETETPPDVLRMTKMFATAIDGRSNMMSLIPVPEEATRTEEEIIKKVNSKIKVQNAIVFENAAAMAARLKMAQEGKNTISPATYARALR